MPGIFGFFDYTKPGKGVDANEPEKRAFFRYFELLWRKLTKLIVVNFMYFICVLPMLILFHLMVYEPLMDYLAKLGGEERFITSPFLSIFAFVLYIPQWLLIVILAVDVIIIGPVTCGLTYILRNYVRSEHAWLSDFWQRAKMNFKQGVFLGFLDCLMFAAGFYNISVLVTAGEVPKFLTWTAIAVFIIYLAMRNTLYLMAVSVELTNGQLIRNALIFSIAGLPRQLLCGIIIAGFVYVTLLVNVFVELFFVPIIGLSLLGFTLVFICYPLIEKHMLKPQVQEVADESL